MKPIGQTFFVSKSKNGVAGIYLSKILVYFKSVDPDKGVVLQLRETDNGYPTSLVVPNSECFAFPEGDYQDAIANPDDYGGLWREMPSHNIAYASDDASVATEFVFKQPPFLEANKSYAFVLIPGGGTDKYEVWTSEIGQTDVALNNIVTKNNDTGTMFISSNDIQWTPVQTEDIKFKIYQATFTSSTGYATLNVANTDSFYIKNAIGTFRKGEMAFITNTVFKITDLTVSSISGTFSNAEVVYQSNGSANVAFGKLQFSNSTHVVIANTRGTFTSSYQVKGVSSSANAVVTTVVDDVTFSSGSNTVNVPYSGIFSANDYIFLAKSNGANGFHAVITSIPSNTTIQINYNAPYTESAGAFIARYNPTFKSFIHTQEISNSLKQAIVVGSQKGLSSSNNYSNDKISGQYILGGFTGAIAEIDSVDELKYNSLTPLLLDFSPKDTSLEYSFIGLDDDGTYDNTDSTYINVKNKEAKELYDKQRIHSNYSNELENRPGTANTSLRLKVNLGTSNNEISPLIDFMTRHITLTENILASDENLSGYYLTLNKTLDNELSVPAIGSSVTFGSNTAEVAYANTTFVRVINNTGLLGTGNMTFDSFTANVSVAERYSENLDNGFDDVARYISKSTTLAPNQEADDAITYLTAYRPANTNVYVYIKALGVNDSTMFDDRTWSLMPESTSTGLLSSKANLNDYIELVYGLPTSKSLFSDSGTCSATSANVTFFNTETLSVGDFIYVKDNANSTFTVREIVSITNSSSVVTSSNIGFTSTNTAVGVIPGLSHENGVFKYHDNEYISRYVNPNGDVHDTIKQFAIKIIMTGDNHYIIPRVADMRTLALQN